MERQLYCVYNQTSESFLSLGVTHHNDTLARLKGMLGKKPQRYDEGNWMDRPKSRYLFRFFSSCDLIFLDDKHRVVGAIQSFPPFRFAPVASHVDSVLALPERTIYSSQTQPGNQLVICVAEEMEFRLRTLPGAHKEEYPEFHFDAESLRPQSSPSPSHDRRSARRRSWPRLVAYDSAGGALEVHGVKDLSANGLYLMTNQRWPLGAQVTMTLQRTDVVDDNGKNNLISVQLRVVRWGKDGVGLVFLQSEAEDSTLMALSAH